MKTKLTNCLFLLSFLFIKNIFSQVVNDHGVMIREGIIRYDQQHQQFKQQNDTLKYAGLEMITQDITVNTDCGAYGSNQNYPDVAQDDHGKYFSCWLDERTGRRRVDGQYFTASGQPIGSVIRLSDRYNNWNSQPHIIFNEVSREYVVAWADDGINIVIQRISESGQKIGTNKIVTDRSILNTNNPSMAVDARGNMTFIWISEGLYFNSNPIYCRIFDKNCEPKGSSFQIMQSPTDYVSSLGWDKCIAVDSAGRALVVWSCYINSRNRIVVQAVDSSGALIGSNTMISDPTDSLPHYFPTVTGLRNGLFLVVWEKEGGNLGGRVYSIDSGLISKQLDLSHKRSGYFTKGVTSNSVDLFVVAYSGWGSSQFVNGIVTVGKDGSIIDSLHTIPEPYFASTWENPNPSVIRNNSFQIAFFGYLASDQDAVIQQFSLPNSRTGSVIKLGNDACSSSQLNPATALNDFGESIVVWEDRKTSTPCIAAQLFDPKHHPIGSNITVNNIAATPWASNASVKADKEGNFVVTFSGGEYNYKDLFLQKVARTGELTGSNKNVTNQKYSYSKYYSVMSFDDQNQLHLVWYGLGGMYPQCSLQVFDDQLNAVTQKKILMSSTQSSIKLLTDASMNGHSEIVLLWTGYDSKHSEHGGALKAMIFNSQGVPISDSIVIQLLDDTRWYMSSRCAIDDDRDIFVAFSDMSYLSYDGKMTFTRLYQDPKMNRKIVVDIYDTRPIFQIPEFKNKKAMTTWYISGSVRGLLLDDNSGSIKPVLLRHYPTFYSSLYEDLPNYSVAVRNDTVALSYCDVIDQERGFDVFLNYQRITGFDFNPSLIHDTTTLEFLSQAYPNPNSDAVKIAYQIKVPTYVDISIFNILGQKLATVVNAYKQIGTYYATFDTKSLPSGVYFFQYKGYQTFSQKFVVRK